MIESLQEIYKFSSQYNIPPIDVCLIALNTLGAKSPLPFLRIRSYFSPKISCKTFYLMICLNTSPSPFLLSNHKIYLKDEIIGKLKKLENDIVEICYFRKRKKVLVLNTNNRAECIGKCKFCGVHLLTTRINKKILSFDDFLNFFKKIESFARIKFYNLEEICLNTGLFTNEKELVEHLINIHKAASILGFSGEIKYIGSQLKSREYLKRIFSLIPSFSYYFTLESLEHNEFIDKRKISSILYINELTKFLKYIKEYSSEISVLYILGLDSLSIIQKTFLKFKKILTRFPVINLFQVYHISHERLRHPHARKINYFLKARKIFEEIFEDTNMRPKLWENYRGLWFTSFGGERLGGQHLQTFIRGY